METKDQTYLGEFVRSRWESIFSSPEAKEFFRTDHSERRQVSFGRYIIFQDLVLDRNKKKLSIIPTSNQTVLLPFDDTKINFANTLKDFQIIAYLSADGSKICDKFDENDSPHVILATFTPAYRYHILYPLFHKKKLVQVMTIENLNIGLNIMKLLQTEDFRMLYQSTGGGSTVNQFHFHSIFARDAGFEDSKFPIENIKPKDITRKQADEVKIELIEREIWAFKFSIKEYELKEKMAEKVVAFIELLLKNIIAHNIFLSELGKAVYVLPRDFVPVEDPPILALGSYSMIGYPRCYDIESKELSEEFIENELKTKTRVSETQMKIILEYLEEH